MAPPCGTSAAWWRCRRSGQRAGHYAAIAKEPSDPRGHSSTSGQPAGRPAGAAKRLSRTPLPFSFRGPGSPKCLSPVWNSRSRLCCGRLLMAASRHTSGCARAPISRSRNTKSRPKVETAVSESPWGSSSAPSIHPDVTESKSLHAPGRLQGLRVGRHRCITSRGLPRSPAVPVSWPARGGETDSRHTAGNTRAASPEIGARVSSR